MQASDRSILRKRRAAAIHEPRGDTMRGRVALVTGASSGSAARPLSSSVGGAPG